MLELKDRRRRAVKTKVKYNTLNSMEIDKKCAFILSQKEKVLTSFTEQYLEDLLV